MAETVRVKGVGVMARWREVVERVRRREVGVKVRRREAVEMGKLMVGVGMVRLKGVAEMAREVAGMGRVKEAVEMGRAAGAAAKAEGERPEGEKRRRRTCKSSSLHRIEFGTGRCSAPRS